MANQAWRESNLKKQRQGWRSHAMEFGPVEIERDTRPPCHTISCRQFFRRGVNDLLPTNPMSYRISKSIDRNTSQEFLGFYEPFLPRIIVEKMVLSKTRSSKTGVVATIIVVRMPTFGTIWKVGVRKDF
jgi:hypothetical protein